MGWFLGILQEVINHPFSSLNMLSNAKISTYKIKKMLKCFSEDIMAFKNSEHS